MMISIWWAVAAFFVGGTAGIVTLALMSSPVRDLAPLERGELEPTR